MNGVGSSLISTLLLRGIALGGRFMFVIFAAANMAPDEFGRFGLLQALAIIVSAMVGLEAYQVLLRRIQNSPPTEAAEVRRAYGLFALGAGLAAALVAFGALAAMDWRGEVLLLGVLIVAGEHIGQEAYRNLVNEGRPARAVLSVALRTGAWGVLIPVLDLAGALPGPWPLELVLLFWLGGLVLGLAASAPLWRSFLPGFRSLAQGNLSSIAREILPQCRIWLVTILAWRVVENGGRFVAAWLISEAAAGRFTLLAMLASISYVAQKGIIEPVYFPRLIGPEYRRSERTFALLSIGCAVAGAAAAAGAWTITLWMSGETPSQTDLVAFTALVLAYGALTISQVAHFRLYRRRRDRRIMKVTAAGAMTTIFLSVALAASLGLSGVAIGTAAGALIILIGKFFRGRG
jgi:O-antigen/teichoic acid export membrane protein